MRRFEDNMLLKLFFSAEKLFTLGNKKQYDDTTSERRQIKFFWITFLLRFIINTRRHILLTFRFLFFLFEICLSEKVYKLEIYNLYYKFIHRYILILDSIYPTILMDNSIFIKPKFVPELLNLSEDISTSKSMGYNI